MFANIAVSPKIAIDLISFSAHIWIIEPFLTVGRNISIISPVVVRQTIRCKMNIAYPGLARCFLIVDRKFLPVGIILIVLGIIRLTHHMLHDAVSAMTDILKHLADTALVIEAVNNKRLMFARMLCTIDPVGIPTEHGRFVCRNTDFRTHKNPYLVNFTAVNSIVDIVLI